MDVLAHAGHEHFGLNLPFLLYAGQVALCVGFTGWCLRIVLQRRKERKNRTAIEGLTTPPPG